MAINLLSSHETHHRMQGGIGVRAARKIVEGWVNDDSLGMLQQLGVVPMLA